MIEHHGLRLVAGRLQHEVQAVFAEQLLGMVDEISLQPIETANTAKLEPN